MYHSLSLSFLSFCFFLSCVSLFLDLFSNFSVSFFLFLFISLFLSCVSLFQDVFNNSYTSFLNTFVMALGEIEYVDNYLPTSYSGPFVVDANILLFVFLFLMPIVLMNLMVKDGCIMSSVVYVGSINIDYGRIMFTVLYIGSVDMKYGCIMFTVDYINSVDGKL